MSGTSRRTDSPSGSAAATMNSLFRILRTTFRIAGLSSANRIRMRCRATSCSLRHPRNGLFRTAVEVGVLDAHYALPTKGKLILRHGSFVNYQ